MRKTVFLFFAVLLSIVFNQCCKENNNGLPLVETSDVDSITFSSALGGGNVINEGESQVTNRGICWSINPDPTIFNNHTSNGTGIGVFTSVMTSLDINTNYYVRAYASNSFGIAYGVNINFSTLEDPNKNWVPGSDWIDIRDEQSYKTVKIGEQVWMAENLNLGVMIPGSSEQSNNGVIEKYCIDNDPNKCNLYGGLYQWTEMMNYISTEGTQGICPDGWHIPTDDDWKQLESELGLVDDSQGLRGTDQGTMLKVDGSTGFEGMMTGYRHRDGDFRATNAAYYWTAKTNNPGWAMNRYLAESSSQIGRNSVDKNHGMSVRCIKDSK